ncbi:hypothetical protein ACMDB5_06330 [Flavobacterium sp. W1B]|uniref:hypothetical protein n=1 Tax=Flavobacterium sp. W1B TaxID=3394146 RepID=UPI0039BD3488
MKTNNTLLILLVFLCQISFGQIKEIEIHGKISVDSNSVEEVNVVNSTTSKSTVSDKNGGFSLFVKEGDVLIFSAVNLVTLRKRINTQDLSVDIVRVQMVVKSIVLNEVIINENPQITAENLGIIPYGQKKYTPAERKLYTATSGGGIDGLLNSISGRKKMIKKEIAVEKKEQALNKLEYLFDEKYYVEKLKIPKDYIQGFQYYCVEDKDFVAALNVKNKTLSMFLITILATKYNKTITDEN